MATRLYLPASAASTPISPDPAVEGWTTTFLERALTSTSKIADTLATVSIDDANSANQFLVFRQYIGPPLTASQTITGSQAVKFQCRVIETNAANNMFLAAVVKIVAADGTTVQKRLVDLQTQGTEASATALTNRTFAVTSNAGDYTTVDGDRPVIEIGMAGNPTGAAHHDSSMRLGDSAASDLPEDETSTDDFNPWVQLADTLTFEAEGETGAISEGAEAGAAFGVVVSALGALTAAASAAAAMLGQADALGSVSAGAEAGEAIAGELTEAETEVQPKQWYRWSFELFDDEHIFFQFPAAAAEGEDTGTLTAQAEAAASFDAQVSALGSLTAGVEAGEAMAGLAAALSSLIAAASAGEAGAGIADAAGAMTSGAEADAVFAAVSAAAAAITAGVEAGESWTAEAAALAELLAPAVAGASFSGLAAALATLQENAAAAASFNALVEGAQEAAFSASSVAAAQFLGAVAALADLAAGANAGADFDAFTGVVRDISAGAEAGATLSAMAAANGQLVAGALAGAVFSARVDAFADWTAGAIAGAVFDFPTEARMVIAGILLAARIAATRAGLEPAVASSDTTLEPMTGATVALHQD